MFAGLDQTLTRWTPAALSVFRVVCAFLYTVAGTSKLFDWPVAAFAAPGVGSWPIWWAGVIEFGAGTLILLGLCTRPAAFLAAGEMAVAYFTQHQPLALWPIDPAQDYGEIAILYCFAFLLLVFTGGGKYTLDALIRR
ncbi:DoxX family protein [Mycobacterium sp. M1]|uniref:DoxX family protein n=1 Tax=Mycolicibacter acidiphilus TaxID=2835306 RepID=A0ABS5RH25_9MYCO|nr:DoxX family protein [Mycolicibacter acidiphilus]MBS9533602.1 DoxX family protein [Mycolicibacter acidiphilus]